MAKRDTHDSSVGWKVKQFRRITHTIQNMDRLSRFLGAKAPTSSRVVSRGKFPGLDCSCTSLTALQRAILGNRNRYNKGLGTENSVVRFSSYSSARGIKNLPKEGCAILHDDVGLLDNE